MDEVHGARESKTELDDFDALLRVIEGTSPTYWVEGRGAPDGAVRFPLRDVPGIGTTILAAVSRADIPGEAREVPARVLAEVARKVLRDPVAVPAEGGDAPVACIQALCIVEPGGRRFYLTREDDEDDVAVVEPAGGRSLAVRGIDS